MWIKKLAVQAIVLVGLLLLTVACEASDGGANAASGSLSQDLGVLSDREAACTGAIDVYVGTDLSGSQRGADHSPLLDVVHDEALTVGACSGRMRVVGFASSATDTVLLGEQTFREIDGTAEANRLAQRKAANALVESVAAALAEPPRTSDRGTDVLAQLGLAEQFHRGGNAVLRVVLRTDGLVTVDAHMDPTTFNRQSAATAASEVKVPQFGPNTTVIIFGIGDVADGTPPLPTSFTDAVMAFYDDVCDRTGATCSVTVGAPTTQ